MNRTAGLFGTPWSLRGVVRRDMAEWTAFNNVRHKLKLSWLAREMLYLGEHPIRFVLSLFALFITTLCLIAVAPDRYFNDLGIVWLSGQSADHLAYFTSLWSVQATLAALVYPFVIAFVTVFLQRRPAAEAFIHLYMLDSAALVSGLSSVALVIAMAIQYVLIPRFGTDVLQIWVALDAIWFLLNAFLTLYFLYRTVEFLRPDIQMNAVQRYLVSVALPRDVARLYLFQVLNQAHKRGWITAREFGDDSEEGGPRIWISRHSSRKGSSQGVIRLRDTSRLVNVRLWLLRLVVETWIGAAKRKLKQENDGFLAGRNEPLLNIPMTPGTEYRDEIQIAYVQNGPTLRIWQRVLLRWAYVFKPTRHEHNMILVASILKELEADVRAAVLIRNNPAFEQAYESLLEVHELLLGACLVEPEDGSIGSWAMLPDIGRFFEQGLHIGWANTYRSIFSAAVDTMRDNSSVVIRVCHFVQHLSGDALNKSPVEVREHVLKMPTYLMFLLGSWWIHRIEEQGVMNHGAHMAQSLLPPLHRVYEQVLLEFAGSWENAREAVADIPDEIQGFAWETAPTLVRLNATHLCETARLLLAAVERGDRAAAEWFADVLAKWWGAFSYENEPFSLYRKGEFLTINDINTDWSDLANILGIADSGEDVKSLQRGVLISALRNFWTDIRLVTLEILLSWPPQSGEVGLKNSLAIEVVAGMLNGKQWRAGGTMPSPLSELSACGYLLAKVRQYATGTGRRSGYEAQLSQFVERIKDMERPEMTGSRVYSFGGADDLESLLDSQLALMIVLSNADWRPSDSLLQQIDVWLSPGRKDHHNINNLRAAVTGWLDRISNADPISADVVTDVLVRTSKQHDAASGRQRTKNAIEDFKQLIESRRNDAIDAAAIDPVRLREMAKFASETGFSKLSGDFPLHLFEIVHPTDQELQTFTLNVSPIRKGELTKVEIEQRAINDKEYLANVMRQRVAAVVLADVLRDCQIRDVPVVDAASYWAVLKDEASLMLSRGEHPILILDNAARPEWIRQWRHADNLGQYPRPIDMRVQRYNNRGSSYICDINDIAIYVGALALGQSILVAREVFASVSFHQYEDGRYVDASVSERSESRELVNLHLEFGRKVQVRTKSAIRLRYLAASEQAVPT